MTKENKSVVVDFEDDYDLIETSASAFFDNEKAKDVFKAMENSQNLSINDKQIVVLSNARKYGLLDIDAFYDVAKLGERKADNNHKDDAVKRLMRIIALKNDDKNKDIVLENNFYAKTTTDILREKLNIKAMHKIVAKSKKDKSTKTFLYIDFKSFYK